MNKPLLTALAVIVSVVPATAARTIVYGNSMTRAAVVTEDGDSSEHYAVIPEWARIARQQLKLPLSEKGFLVIRFDADHLCSDGGSTFVFQCVVRLVCTQGAPRTGGRTPLDLEPIYQDNTARAFDTSDSDYSQARSVTWRSAPFTTDARGVFCHLDASSSKSPGGIGASQFFFRWLLSFEFWKQR
jgi:hypothetical protein